MSSMQMGGFIRPVTITDVLERTPTELQQFLNIHVLSNALPIYQPDRPLSVQNDILPRLGRYANDQGYVTELYNVVVSGYYAQKGHKRLKENAYDEGVYTDLEAKKEILYRTLQAIDRYYEAASRIMTGIGVVDEKKWGRVP